MKKSLKVLLAGFLIVLGNFIFIACNKGKEENFEMIVVKDTKEVLSEKKNQHKDETIEPLEEVKNTSKQVVYERSKDYNPEAFYKIDINVKNLDKYAELVFDEYGLNFTTFDEDKNKDGIPDDSTTYYIAKNYEFEIGEYDENNINYKVIGNKAYKIDFDKGDFGIACLLEDKNGQKKVAVMRFHWKEVSSMIQVPGFDVIDFENGFDNYIPSEFSPEGITVNNNKDIVITFSDNHKEVWRVKKDEFETYKLFKIN